MVKAAHTPRPAQAPVGEKQGSSGVLLRTGETEGPERSLTGDHLRLPQDLRASPGTWLTSERQGFGGVDCLQSPVPHAPLTRIFCFLAGFAHHCFLQLCHVGSLLLGPHAVGDPEGESSGLCLVLLGHQLSGSHPSRSPQLLEGVPALSTHAFPESSAPTLHILSKPNQTSLQKVSCPNTGAGGGMASKFNLVSMGGRVGIYGATKALGENLFISK